LKVERGFFRGYLAHNFADAISKEIHLPEDGVEDFKHFMRWLYSGDFDITVRRIWEEAVQRYLGAYMLGKKLICPGYQNRVVKNMLSLLQKVSIPPFVLMQLFALDLEDSKLMKYLVKQIACAYVNKPEFYTDEKTPEYASSWEQILVHDAGLAQQLLDTICEMGKAYVNPAYQDPEKWY
jgi:hypothetical protein